MTLLSLPYWNRTFHWVLMIIGCLLNLGFGSYVIIAPLWDKTARQKTRDMFLFSMPFLGLGLHFGYMVKVFRPWPLSSTPRMFWVSRFLHWLLNIAGAAFFGYVLRDGIKRHDVEEDKRGYAIWVGVLVHFLSIIWFLRPWQRRQQPT